MANPLENRTVLVTGATSGIGFAVVQTLLKSGFSIIAVGSRPQRCDEAKVRLEAEFPHGDFTFFSADLSLQREVRGLASQVKDHLDHKPDHRLFCLINNAGALKNKYQETEEGIEYQFATNHLAGFLLTYLLLPYLQGGLVLSTTSYSSRHARIRWNDIMHRHGYFSFFVYRQSKLFNVMTASEINRRSAALGIRAAVVDPGLVMTNIGEKGIRGIALRAWLILKRKGTTAEVPARTFAFLCQNPQAEGLYFKDSLGVSYNRIADDPKQTGRLFALSEKLCGIAFSDFRKP